MQFTLRTLHSYAIYVCLGGIDLMNPRKLLGNRMKASFLTEEVFQHYFQIVCSVVL